MLVFLDKRVLELGDLELKEYSIFCRCKNCGIALFEFGMDIWTHPSERKGGFLGSWGYRMIIGVYVETPLWLDS